MWPANGKPILVRPDDNVVELRVEGNVLVLDDSCKVFPKEKYRKDKQLKKLFAMPTSQSCPAHESEDEELLDELVPEDDSHEYQQETRRPHCRGSQCKASVHAFSQEPILPNMSTCTHDGPTCSSQRWSETCRDSGAW